MKAVPRPEPDAVWAKGFLLFLIHEPPEPQAGLKADGDLHEHVGHFLLHQLVPGQRNTKLHSGVPNISVPDELNTLGRLNIVNSFSYNLYLVNFNGLGNKTI